MLKFLVLNIIKRLFLPKFFILYGKIPQKDLIEFCEQKIHKNPIYDIER